MYVITSGLKKRKEQLAAKDKRSVRSKDVRGIKTEWVGKIEDLYKRYIMYIYIDQDPGTIKTIWQKSLT